MEIKYMHTKFATNITLMLNSRSFKYFGLEFFGECYTGATAEIDYARDGDSNDCHTGNMDGSGEFLVGKEYSIMVYRAV